MPDFTSVTLVEGGPGRQADTGRADSVPADRTNTNMNPPYVALTEEVPGST